ncbi:MAG: stage 0 sporulation family protein [Oscillospiraceae bacterium]|nr:stage 0 sporulation family protein [Oscillospiraceae bacterium]
MTEIIGVRFKDVGKIYHFSPNGKKLKKGDSVIVETSRGVELGNVVLGNKQLENEETNRPLKSIMRIASPDDIERHRNNRKREKEILAVFSQKVAEHKLAMKPIDIDCTFDGSKILFFFTAESRVDFRELVKDLAGIYRTRIELRQIGVRDEAKMLGGLGICGRQFCCSGFLGEFQPVSIKMAKEQSLSLNPTKISGTCGRLMCCLKYEQDCYEELLKTTPRVGAFVETAEGKGVVNDVNLLKGVLKVKLNKNEDDAPPVPFKKDDVKLLPPLPNRDRQARPNRENKENNENKKDGKQSAARKQEKDS